MTQVSNEKPITSHLFPASSHSATDKGMPKSVPVGTLAFFTVLLCVIYSLVCRFVPYGLLTDQLLQEEGDGAATCWQRVFSSSHGRVQPRWSYRQDGGRDFFLKIYELLATKKTHEECVKKECLPNTS